MKGAKRTFNMAVNVTMTGRGRPVAARYTARIDGWRPKTSIQSRNGRAHWARVKRADAVAKAVAVAALHQSGWPESLPDGGAGWRLTITVYQRLGKLADSDNVTTACKAIRDACAQYLSVDDGPGGIDWRVEIRRGPDAVELTLERVEDAA